MEKNVLKWLEEFTGDPTYYLKPLNLVWEEDEIEPGLDAYRKVADRLENYPDYFKEILSAETWRENLTGYVCLMLSGGHNYIEILENRFIEGSFVSPQLAVAISRLNKEKCLDFFFDCLNVHFQNDTGKSKQIGAIVSLVPSLTNNRGNVIELNGLKIESYEFCTGISVAEEHNHFWWMREQSKG